MITVEEQGSFGEIEQWLIKMAKIDPTSKVDALGSKITSALRPRTPFDTGLTQDSWQHQTKKANNGVSLEISNSSENGFNVVQALRHGHGTGTGGYVPPNDFVTPVVEPLIESATDMIVRSVVQ